jgi:hypothetical protein
MIPERTKMKIYEIVMASCFLQSVFSPSLELLFTFALCSLEARTRLYSARKKWMLINSPPAKKLKMAIWIRAIPQIKATTVVQKRKLITILMYGISKIAPPGERISDTKDVIVLMGF